MVEVSKELKKFLRRIPCNLLSELWCITQEIPYVYTEDQGIDWRKIDEFSRQISYAHRAGNNPEV